MVLKNLFKMRKLFFLLSFLLILSLLIGAIGLSLQFFYIPISHTQKPLVFVIPQGATTEQIADILKTQGTPRFTYYFLAIAKWSGHLKQIKAGEYQIAPEATLQQLIEKLAKGQIWLHKITFPEGWTFEQFIHLLATEPRLSHTLSNQNNENIMALIGHPGEHPEGLFYPDTYLFSLGTKDTQILRASYNLMQKKLAQAWATRAPNLPCKTPYEALVVASLIERETALPHERSMVAGVILHRLRIGMRLQIDATVLYGLSNKNHHTLNKTDLTTDTAYNTYTRTGLPPTPIAMPSITSIQAALHPAFETALYYVAKGDGSHSHVFSDTLEAHQVAVKAYRKNKIAIDAHG